MLYSVNFIKFDDFEICLWASRNVNTVWLPSELEQPLWNSIDISICIPYCNLRRHLLVNIKNITIISIIISDRGEMGRNHPMYKNNKRDNLS